MIELVGQKVLAAALIVGLSLGFGFLPAVLAKKYLQHIQKNIYSTYKKVFAALTKKYLQHIEVRGIEVYSPGIGLSLQ